MERLPKDINIEFFYQLKWPDNINLCQTNKRWAKICEDKKIWRNVMKRDFPWYYHHIPKEQSTREAYNQIWTLLNQAAGGLMRNYKWVNPKYANLKLMKEDIITELGNKVEEYAKTRDIDKEGWEELNLNVLTILTGLLPRNIGSGPDELDLSETLGIEFTREVQNLFYQLGYSREGEKFEKPGKRRGMIIDKD